MGSTRFLVPPPKVLVELVLAEIFDLSELDLFNAVSASLTSASPSNSEGGLSERGLASSEAEGGREEGELGSSGRNSDSGVVGVTGMEAVVTSVEIELERSETPDTERPRVRASLTTSCICRLSGFLDDVGGGRTMM
jgi:hypothetical protein